MISTTSPATLDGISIDIKKITEPKTKNHLVIEGAGGVFVPLNDKDCVIDLIQPEYKAIVVSRHYLGSINHALLSVAALKQAGISLLGIIFNGDMYLDNAEIINFLGELKLLITSVSEKTITSPPMKKAKINAKNGSKTFFFTY